MYNNKTLTEIQSGLDATASLIVLIKERQPEMIIVWQNLAAVLEPDHPPYHVNG